jgi:hypothetical protein
MSIEWDLTKAVDFDVICLSKGNLLNIGGQLKLPVIKYSLREVERTEKKDY